MVVAHPLVPVRENYMGPVYAEARAAGHHLFGDRDSRATFWSALEPELERISYDARGQRPVHTPTGQLLDIYI